MNPKDPDGRDALDQEITKALRRRRARAVIPVPGRGEPSDDELLRVVDGTASLEERERVTAGGEWTKARLEVLREALCLSEPDAIFGKRMAPAEYVNGNLVTHGRPMQESQVGGADQAEVPAPTVDPPGAQQ